MKILLFIILTILVVNSYCQEVINVQRPTQTESYSIITPGVIQSENGIAYISTDSFGYSTFFRLGLSPRIEFRAASDLRSKFLDLGAKIVITKPQEILPGTAFIVNYDIHSGVTNFTFSASNSFATKYFYTFNIGKDTDWYSIYLLGRSIGDKAAAYTEFYLQEVYQQLNFGATYRLTDNMQVDVSAGALDFKDYYISTGFSFRILQK